MSITLYYSPQSSSSRVHWALEELGIPYEAVRVNLAEGEQRKPEYLAINPNGKVPAMVIDGVPMFESLAMLILLGELYGVEKGLYPAPGPARGEALKWMTFGLATLTPTFLRYMLNTSERIPADQRNARVAELAREDAGRQLKVVDDALQDRDYLLGSEFTFADLTLASLMAFASRLGFDLSPWPSLQAWSARCLARPAFARVPRA